jgi:Transposase DDE domain
VPTERRSPRQSICADQLTRGPRGYDGAKNLCGRQRHLLVDTLGLVLLVVVTEANVQDRDVLSSAMTIS